MDEGSDFSVSSTTLIIFFFFLIITILVGEMGYQTLGFWGFLFVLVFVFF